MTIIIKKGETPAKIEAAKKRLQKRKEKLPALRDFYGKLKGTFGDGLTYQKKLRDEWN